MEFYGFTLDSITVLYARPFEETQENSEENSEINFKNLFIIFIGIGSLPKNIHGCKSFMLVVDDLWLYNYDKRQYRELMQVVLTAIQEIESVKWSLFNYYALMPQFLDEVKISNYTPYSNAKYNEVEEKDSSFARSVGLFSVLTVPQMLILCLVLWRIFLCIKNFKWSVYLRRYCFTPNYVQIVLEPNISYFTYLFFNQTKNFFAFNFWDKISLAFSVVFMMIVLLCSICFFILVNEFYEKKSGYFLHNFYRTPKGILYATLRINIRGLIYGMLHSLLYEYYTELMVSLIAIEFIFLVVSAYLEMTDKVYLARIHFWLEEFYHLLLILLNLALLYEYKYSAEEDDQGLAMLFQKTVIYFLAVITIFSIVIDFIPLECSNK